MAVNITYQPLSQIDIALSQCSKLDKIVTKGYKTIYRFLLRAEETSPAAYTEIGGAQADWILPAEGKLTIVSTSANDTANAGTHLRTIQVIGYNSSGWVFETISLDGVQPVDSVNDFKYVLHAKALTWGANEEAAGIITITDAVPTTFLTIPLGAAESNGSKMLIPEGYHGLVTDVYASHVTSAGTNDGKSIVKYNRRSIDGQEYNPNRIAFAYRAFDEASTHETGCIQANDVFDNDTYIDFQLKRITSGQDASVQIFGYIYQ
jgi:hypothetical protein